MPLTLTRLSFDSSGRPSLGSGVALGPGEATEANLRQDEWDRQMESLDTGAHELGKAQFRLIREQTATFVRDLSALRQEVVGLKASQAYMEQTIGLANDKISKEFGQRINVIERFVVDSCSRHDAQESATRMLKDIDLKLLQDGHGRLHDANCRIEKLLGDSAEKHQNDLRALKEEQDKCLKHLEDIRQAIARHASLPERVDYLEKLMGQSADKHAKEIQSAKDLQTTLQTTVSQRLDYIEKMLGDSADKQARELAELDRSFRPTIASLPQRMEYLEKLLGDVESAALKRTHVKEEMDTELAGVRSALVMLPQRLDYMEKLHEQDLMKLQAADDQITRDLLPMLESRTEIEERMRQFEAHLYDVANKSWWC
mmetsp:Transcript_13356/g.47163  ORF Transcript_13356/g.47163 Transcript_13356/m.47163 type:complete len:371 (+) Transcript_13356:70-1182(+)|eukprot:CAMPEP_0203931356 /NCGR_PEP_ID=MMETSP0359-20131031/69948_1 /ASSEMBLY_ACC=CAM_ASM_000338 /TAXON_ID=268821 /ORGANISM="Scrippsiella Hangoei, Strain SHTV-5" /LENGTH=370 /DNA_ID=CAMNT_0050860673 /DNA_START=49 /DNA_END=1161 /DNA_ORIENTATION=-